MLPEVNGAKTKEELKEPHCVSHGDVCSVERTVLLTRAVFVYVRDELLNLFFLWLKPKGSHGNLQTKACCQGGITPWTI